MYTYCFIINLLSWLPDLMSVPKIRDQEKLNAVHQRMNGCTFDVEYDCDAAGPTTTSFLFSSIIIIIVIYVYITHSYMRLRLILQ